MPSTTSSSVSSDLASSTVITPSLPTFFMASARNFPISASPLAEMVATWAISSFDVTSLEFLCRSATTAATARSTPRLRSIGFMPAATALAPSRTMAWASTVAVVVPSPACSDVLEATSRTICAPMFSNLSSSSMSLATVTPSLVIRGGNGGTSNLAVPSFFRARHRPIPRDDGWGSGGLPAGYRFGEHSHDVGFLHDQVLDAVDLDFGARPLAEQHAVAGLDVDRGELSGLVAAAGTDCDDLALLRFFLGGIRDDDAAGRLRVGVDSANDHAVVKGAEFHWGELLLLTRSLGGELKENINRRGLARMQL